MISAIHILALIPVSVLLFFMTVVPQGDASGGASAGPIATCAACATATRKWCIKELGSATERKLNKFCGKNDKAGNKCLGGMEQATCPVEAPAADVTGGVAIDTCDKCVAVTGHKWCIKDGTPKVKFCTTTALCPATSGVVPHGACTIPDGDKLITTADPANTCDKCVSAGKKWCIQAYGESKNTHCVAAADGCVGGMIYTACPGDATYGISVDTCEKCIAAELKHTWCLKGNGTAQVRTCVHKDQAGTACKAVDGVVASTDCQGLKPEEKRTTDLDETACKTCVADTNKQWCKKDYGTGAKQASFCADKVMKPDHCLGGTASTTCDGSAASQEIEPDYETCETCVAAQHKWCGKVEDNNPKLNICLSAAKATTECANGLVPDCSKIDEKDRKAGHRESAKGGASTLTMGWSAVVLSAILVAAV